MAFRPFFLLGALWSGLALACWIALLAGHAPLPSRFDPLGWHIHEMLFGFVLAAVAGFILTAVPNWTGRKCLSGWPLAGLVLLWVLGRIGCAFSALLPAALVAALDGSFAFTLAAIVAVDIVRARNRRNYLMPLPIVLLGIANLLMHAEAAGLAVPAGLGWRLGIAAIVVLMLIIGGRIVPAFTRNWLAKRPAARLPSEAGSLDLVALLLACGAIVLWAVLPLAPLSGGVLLLGAAASVWRLSRWCGLATLAEPLLAILHLGYGWICVGLGLLGASLFWPQVPAAAAIHALTAGAMGTLILAMVTRVSRGHTGRPLRAGGTETLLYACITISVAVRLAAAFGGNLVLLKISAAFWIAAFAGFAVLYAPMLFTARADR
jgi:uncharacterized protein involved in response to NO